ncbi:NFACT RNA binding domain-containing protein [Serpentinicella sp. ANB-PHB4]|uniref:Rqc2 family fibronectin-binding protein n=1 Tax=Serpentinicella sp. ANB-PHB4 TaxID=3074076 RepID=UPI00285E2CBE|nr:NFACT RNA binding domain-containing protein [Serpentinicella sp. ANB-PHB4]MDR5658332.1 NFACT RNA binding domain-containing protein [Serpentinicella sp. ANB-PHB4]
MALDGLTVSAIVDELSQLVSNNRIEKIYQPEKDEILIIIRSKGSNRKLLLSCHSNYPRAHFTTLSKENPVTPPSFCMLLRKNLTGGRIISVTQPNFERIINLEIETYDELNIKKSKMLIIEMMGKHSNIILVDNETKKIIESIKRISFDMSRFRQVLPGLTYEMPPNNKNNPLSLSNTDDLTDIIDRKTTIQIYKALYSHFTGISPLIAKEICHNASIDFETPINKLDDLEIRDLFFSLSSILTIVSSKKFEHLIFQDVSNKKYIDFSVIPIKHLSHYTITEFDSISELLDNYYSVNDHMQRIKQKSQTLRKNINTKLDRLYNKLINLKRDYDKALKGDHFKILGDLITANLYQIKSGESSTKVTNFYSSTQENIEIKLDKRYSPSKNAQNYYKKYTKSKNALVEVAKQVKVAESEIRYLEQIQNSIEQCTTLQDLEEIYTELVDGGYVKEKSNKKKQHHKKNSSFLSFKSTDNFKILVGKNNKQNEEITFKHANKTDIWLHVKDLPGSHVIVQLDERQLSEVALTEAASLAAFYSKARNSSKVAVDYTTRKNVRKQKGGKPGMVFYDHYSTILVDAFEKDIQKIEKTSSD